jgi:hypothetical protein
MPMQMQLWIEKKIKDVFKSVVHKQGLDSK